MLIIVSFDSNNDDDTVNRETNHGVIINPNGEIMAFGFVRSHDYFSNSVFYNFLCFIIFGFNRMIFKIDLSNYLPKFKF